MSQDIDTEAVLGRLSSMVDGKESAVSARRMTQLMLDRKAEFEQLVSERAHVQRGIPSELRPLYEQVSELIGALVQAAAYVDQLGARVLELHAAKRQEEEDLLRTVGFPPCLTTTAEPVPPPTKVPSPEEIVRYERRCTGERSGPDATACRGEQASRH